MKPVITGSSQATFLHESDAVLLAKVGMDKQYGDLLGPGHFVFNNPSLGLDFCRYRKKFTPILVVKRNC